MSALLQWIAKSCDEEPGVPSAMRLVVVCGSAFSVNVPGFLWIFAALVPATHKDQALAVAQGASLFFGATLSALLTAKIIQRGKEQ